MDYRVFSTEGYYQLIDKFCDNVNDLGGAKVIGDFCIDHGDDDLGYLWQQGVVGATIRWMLGPTPTTVNNYVTELVASMPPIAEVPDNHYAKLVGVMRNHLKPVTERHWAYLCDRKPPAEKQPGRWTWGGTLVGGHPDPVGGIYVPRNVDYSDTNRVPGLIYEEDDDPEEDER